MCVCGVGGGGAPVYYGWDTSVVSFSLNHNLRRLCMCVCVGGGGGVGSTYYG